MTLLNRKKEDCEKRLGQKKSVKRSGEAFRLAAHGRLSGLFFILVFLFRFLIELIKEEQSHLIDEQWLNMGQWLSIPMILFGLILLMTGVRKEQEESIDLKV